MADDLDHDELEIARADDFDPDARIRDEFGDDVAFIVAVSHNAVPVVIKQKGAHNPGQRFPKISINLRQPTQITVLPWDGSPGCRTVIINGREYEVC